jgi:hypothetical protein
MTGSAPLLPTSIQQLLLEQQLRAVGNQVTSEGTAAGAGASVATMANGQQVVLRGLASQGAGAAPGAGARAPSAGLASSSNAVFVNACTTPGGGMQLHQARCLTGWHALCGTCDGEKTGGR